MKTWIVVFALLASVCAYAQINNNTNGGSTITASLIDNGGQGYSVKAFGALGTTNAANISSSHPVSGWCTNHGGTRFTAANDGACLTAIQAAVPEVTTLTNEMDWAAVNQAIDASRAAAYGGASYAGTVYLPPSSGCYSFDVPLSNGNGVILSGGGSPGTCINYYGTTYAIVVPANGNSYTIEDLDIFVTNHTGGGIQMGGLYRHVLIKQVNISLPSSGSPTGYGEDVSGAGIDMKNQNVRVTWGTIGFHVATASSANQWECDQCYANAATFGFAFSGGVAMATCIQCAADANTSAGYYISPGAGNTVHLIDSTGETNGVTYQVQGAAGSIILEQPQSRTSVAESFKILTSPSADLTIIHPITISTGGTNSFTFANTISSFTIIGNSVLDKAMDAATLAALSPVSGAKYATTTNCAAAGSAANPSAVACSAAASGSFSCATNASTGTCVVSTTAVTANSRIFIQPSAAEGTNLSVTCNTTADTGLTAPRLASKSAGTSFTVNVGTFATNPLCFNFWVVN